MTLTAYTYARRSRVSENQASVTDQIDRAREDIEARGWHPGEVLNEEVSASRYARRQREAWPVLMDALEAGKVGVLVLWESSRGDRKLSEWARLLDLCRDHGTLIHVISHERTYDLANHRDWKTLASEGVDNDHFSQRLSADVRRGKRGAARRGRPQGAPPYGYRVRYDQRTGKPAGWDVVSGQDEAVRRIVRGISGHVPVRQVMTGLNDDGVPSPTGGLWTAEPVRYIARNPSYAGLVRLPDGTLVGRGPEYPAIVTRQEWEAADAVLRPRTGARPNASVYLLSFITACECGGLMTSAGRPAPRSAYRCERGHNYVNGAWLDERVGYLVCAKLALPDARDLYAADDDGRAGRLRGELAVLEERRARYRAKAAKAADQAEAEDADAVLDELRPLIAAKKRQLGEIRFTPALRDILTADDVFAAWEAYTVQARRDIIMAVTGISVRRVPVTARAEERYDVARVVPDWVPQQQGAGNRAGRRIARGG